MAEIEQVYDVEQARYVYEVHTPRFVLEFDEERNELQRAHRAFGGGGGGGSSAVDATIRHPAFMTGASQTTPTSGERPRVDSRSPYRLQLDEALDRGIEPVENSGGPEVTQTTPTFNDPIDRSAGRQQTAFFWAQRAR